MPDSIRHPESHYWTPAFAGVTDMHQERIYELVNFGINE